MAAWTMGHPKYWGDAEPGDRAIMESLPQVVKDFRGRTWTRVYDDVYYHAAQRYRGPHLGADQLAQDFGPLRLVRQEAEPGELDA